MVLRVFAHLHQLPSDVRIPVVLYLIVCSSRQPSSYQGPPVAEEGMELDDEVFFVLGKVSTFDIRLQIIYPSQPATFSTTMQPWDEELQE